MEEEGWGESILGWSRTRYVLDKLSQTVTWERQKKRKKMKG
jgi:hypothetical protein